MSLPKVVSQEEWTAARCTMLEKEKDFTRQRDRLNTERREQPMVEVTKPCEPVRRDHRPGAEVRRVEHAERGRLEC
jgi:Bacterial protein of unknown function (DUF899)